MNREGSITSFAVEPDGRETLRNSVFHFLQDDLMRIFGSESRCCYGENELHEDKPIRNKILYTIH